MSLVRTCGRPYMVGFRVLLSYQAPASVTTCHACLDMLDVAATMTTCTSSVWKALSNLTVQHVRVFCTSKSRTVNTEIITKDKVFIDTNGLVNTLEEQGFQKQQAEVLTSILLNLFSKNAEIVSKETITKEQLEITTQTIMSHISAVKKDMVILERSEFSALRTENERLQDQVTQLRKQLQDDITNLGNKFLLDINLEKGRVKEETHAHRMLIESNKYLITTEVANVMSKLEATKNDIFRYFAGTLLGCLTIALGFYRIWAK